MLQLQSGRPADLDGQLAEEVRCYDLLDALGVAYQRIDHPAAETMEVCADIDRALGTLICKNLFLCNRQQTQFYLLMMPGDKRFFTKELSRQLGVARLSFASAEQMRELLNTAPGSVSVLGLMNDRENRVQLVMDAPVAESGTFGCHPCRNTSSLRLRTADLLETILPAIHHTPIFVHL